jgi:hypothetical protein
MGVVVTKPKKTYADFPVLLSPATEIIRPIRPRITRMLALVRFTWASDLLTPQALLLLLSTTSRLSAK